MAELVLSQPEAALEAKPYETSDVNINPLEAYERGKTDINFFACLLIPQVMVSAFPDFYIGLFHILTAREGISIGRILRFALGLPRGHAKTTFIKVIITWLIAYDKISFGVVICANQDLANELLSDVSDMLSSSNAELVYGAWSSQLTTDSKELKKAVYHGRNVILAAKGAGTAIRGINVKHRRPDLIFCDDAQTKENDDSPTDSIKFRKWLIATFKIVAPAGDRLIIYVGNMYSENCILFQLKNNPSWVSLITGAIKEDGVPLWAELHSLEELMESYFHDEAMGEAEVWFAEVMNDPVNKATSLINGVIEEFDGSEVVPDGVFLTVDPAGFRDGADDNVIVVHYVHDGKGMVAEIDAGNKDPEQLILQTLRLALHHGASLIGIEDAAYQQTLLFWVTKYITELSITGITVVPLKNAGRSKESRIRLFVAELLAGNYKLFAAIRAVYVWQAMKYKLGKKKNKDDILDAVAYGLDVRTTYWQYVTNLRNTGKFAQDARVVSGNTPF